MNQSSKEGINKQRKLYRHFFVKNIPSALKIRFLHKAKSLDPFNGVKGINLEKSNQVLKEALSSNKPFCAIHFGGSELSGINNYEKIRLGLSKTYKDKTRYAMRNNAGFFPADDEHLKEFGKRWLDNASKVDILGLMGYHMEDYFQAEYLPKAQIILYEGMEPLRGDWSKKLKGRKVLVVSPFKEEIIHQYAIRQKLFLDDPEILPEFSLQVVEPPLTLGDSQPKDGDSFSLLEKTKEEIRGLDFDVALVGAGAYTSFLCVYIKELGKQAIGTGGATQTLFGIMGKRWENREHVSKHVNEYWIRPYKKAEGFAKIEGGAYW